MTQDYRKRAEELIKAIEKANIFTPGFNVNIIVETLYEVAQEAQREENEACARVCENIYHIDSAFWSNSTPDQCAKIIRARMGEK